MVANYELVEVPADSAGADLERLQGKALEQLALVRCPQCGGLRSISHRNRDSQARCKDCRQGKVVTRTRYHNYWLERFSLEEIVEMGKAIWG